MIEAEQLVSMDAQLRVYDVDQGGWEHEGQGLEVNVRHVHDHLSQDITGKNFRDPAEVREAIAPDAVQYALRLARWTTSSAVDLIPTGDDTSRLQHLWNTNLSGLQSYHAAWIEASATLARNFQLLAHPKDREAAQAEQSLVARKAGRLLLYSGLLASQCHGFNVEYVFQKRLTSLRRRFNIPDPETA